MKGSIISGGIHGLLAVALGAFGAHALKEILDDYSTGIWDTAVQYQMFHATAILIIGVLMSTKLIGNIATLRWAAILMNLGILFFAGSLYVLALSGIKVLGAITPIGGVLFISGWVLVIISALKHAK